jgi:hypothetical protein
MNDFTVIGKPPACPVWVDGFPSRSFAAWQALKHVFGLLQDKKS